MTESISLQKSSFVFLVLVFFFTTFVEIIVGHALVV